MRTPHCLKAPLILAAMLGLPLAHATTLSSADYDAAKTRISADYKIDEARCDALAGTAKSVCGEEAKGTEKIARADLEYSHSGTPHDQNQAQIVRADSAFAIAKEKCARQAGNDKEVCVQEAKGAQTKAMSDIKMGKQVSAAKSDNAGDKREADYKVAVDKCDAAAGDAKNSCLAAAKMRFEKS
jgi:hypothetical protein